MKRSLLVLVLMLGASSALAQPAEQNGGAVDPPRRLNTMSLREREHEMEQQNFQGASGFWTSPYKATHGAYRYRLMLIGCALVLGTGLFVSRLVKKANADRAARNNGGHPLGDLGEQDSRRSEQRRSVAAGDPDERLPSARVVKQTDRDDGDNS